MRSFISALSVLAVLGIVGCSESPKEPVSPQDPPVTQAAAPKTTPAPVAQASPAPVALQGQALLGMDGRLRVTVAGDEFCTFSPVMSGPDWAWAAVKPQSYRQEGLTRKFTLTAGKLVINGQASAAESNGAVNAAWAFTGGPIAGPLAALAVSADIAADDVTGGTWSADDKTGQFPQDFDQMHLFNGPAKQLTVAKGAKKLTIVFPQPTNILIQDNRRWNQTFSLRIGRQASELPTGQTLELPMTIQTHAPLAVKVDSQVTITAGDQWIPLNTQLEIEPGSALDFSGMGFVEAPCGKDGRVIVSKDGHFAFEKRPNEAKRFYGVNLCFDAQYLPKEQVDQLTDRLVRLGYNTLRIHHYEGKLAENKPGFDWSKENLDRLDYLLAACKKRGIYVTTDLFVSRPVALAQIGLEGEGRVEMDQYKVLVPVHEPAFADFEKFTRMLLDRVNPYTGVRWADEPTLAWLSMINEGNFGNHWKYVKPSPQWAAAWNKWLARRYGDRAALSTAWGAELKQEEDAAKGSVKLPDQVNGETPRHRDCVLFLAETETAMFDRMAKLLRDELKCRALLTNMNAWTNHAPNQLPRTHYDYVDDHFYVDHPNFLEKSWQLPSRCANENPVRQGATGGRGGNTLRLFGKPFTVSEYNYSGPGRFRGVGGILTGAMGALQDWDVIWRFAYSHSSRNMFTPSTMGYFDLATDPLNQAADRAAVMLYLRGDLKKAPGQVAMVLTPQDLTNLPNKVPTMGQGPSWVTWITRLGSVVVDDPAKAPEGAVKLFANWSKDAQAGLDAFGTDRAKLMAELRKQGVITGDNPTDPARNVYRSQTGEVLIDGPNGLLQFDTERTGGGYADPGQTIASKSAGVRVSDLSIGATVFVTSVDGKPIKSSSRLLVTHLTDLQNTETTYAEEARQTLLAWGKMPHLVRAGTAKVEIAADAPGQWTVYSLATSGKRLAEVPAQVKGKTISFTCDVKGPDGARMLYELVRK